MKNRTLALFIFLPFLLFSCSKKSLPSKSPLGVETIIDSSCLKELELLKNQPTNINCDDSSFIDFCNILRIHNIDLIKKLSDKDHIISTLNQVIDSLEKRPLTIIDKSRTKIRNSNNTKIKNSNNETEIYKLKNSIIAKDSAYLALEGKFIALGAKIKDMPKNGSSTGEQSPATNKSGNTSNTNKAAWYLWLITFLAGGATAIGVRAAITKSI
jgi:hypothetical protein